MNIEPIEQGSLLQIYTGEWRDRYLLGTFVALQDITFAKVSACAETASKDVTYGYSPASGALEGLVPKMIRAGLLLKVDCSTLHIGEGGLVDPTFGVYSDIPHPGMEDDG